MKPLTYTKRQFWTYSAENGKARLWETFGIAPRTNENIGLHEVPSRDKTTERYADAAREAKGDNRF